MKALVVYDSLYGNTEQIAQAIGVALKSQADVQVLRAGDVKLEQLAGLGLLVAGSPTHGMHVSEATAAWLKSLPRNSLRGIGVAAFDTRVDVATVAPSIVASFTRLFGFAAGGLAKSLTRLGGTQVIPAAGFIVLDTKGPLKEGELDRAAAWSQQILAKL